MTAELAIAGSSDLITRQKVDGATPCAHCGTKITYETEMEMYIPNYTRGDLRLYQIIYVCRTCFKDATYRALAEMAQRIRRALTFGVVFNKTHKRNMYRIIQAKHGILPASDPRFNQTYAAIKKGGM